MHRLKLLCLCAVLLAGTLSASAPLLINGIAPKDGVFNENNRGWTFDYSQKLLRQNETGPELRLTRGWKIHPSVKYITGYNGEIVLKIKAPGRIEKLSTSIRATNYADSTKRHICMAYSLDGAEYRELGCREFGGGRVILENQTAIPENRGFLWIRFYKKLPPKDLNGRHGYILFEKLSLHLEGQPGPAVSCTAAPAASAQENPLSLKNVFPTGVFWPWEYTESNAKAAGMEFWQFVDAMMKLLKSRGCNTMWFVNMGYKSMPKVLVMAEKNGMKAMLNTELLDVFYNGAGSMERMDQLAQQTANRLQDYPALLGYILKDEPLLCNLESCNFIYDLMKKADPARDSAAVVMNRQTMTYLRESKMPVICTDLYYFGHYRSTNMPNPAPVSQRLITEGLEGYNTQAELFNKHSWFMGQLFASVWGPHYVRNGKTYVEPGCYLHNKMPSHGETRWQIWEAVRTGSKGVFFYLFLSGPQLKIPPSEVKPGTPEAKILARMEKLAEHVSHWKKQWLVDKQMVFDDPADCMTEFGGKPTPQMDTMGEAFKILRAHEKLLVKKKTAEFPVFFSGDSETDVNTFEAGDSRRYGVVVNRNLNKDRNASVLLPLNIKSVKNLNTGKMLAIQPAGKHFQKITCPLKAGDGMILEAEFSTFMPGMPVCREKFDQFSQFRVKFHKNSTIRNHGEYGVDATRSVFLTGDSTKPVFSLENLTNFKTPYNTLTMNINCRKAAGTIYCLIKGRLKTAVVKAVSVSKDSEKANLFNLAESNFKDAQKEDGERKTLVLQNSDFWKPVAVPVGTTSLEFFLSNQYDHISEMNVWFVPFEKK